MAVHQNFHAASPGEISYCHYLCDLESERPSSGLREGDTAFAKDTNKQWVALSATTWQEMGGGGAHPDLAAHDTLGLATQAELNAHAATPHGGISTLKKTADQIINGTAFQDITGLTFAVSPSTDYAFDFYITFRSVTTGTGFRFGINSPSGAVLDYFITYQTVANMTTAGVATWLQGHVIANNTMNVTSATIAAGVDLHCRMTGRVKIGATGGTLAARAASEAANNDLVVQKGSWGTYF